ncbi:MAG TPA: HPr(Ser) kinase/phosphatase [candidate division WOR-3 bacterium]|uniref:HPr kinase/phosphorylase n=1 Tax=candidate division WOR-3 bacterium TaxID=2052148 RepID=A0A9C9EMM7_UNCW3|nr:HPr(Ser) kinase/phosphatase [candidate division WOR-3 bacterium]
MKKITVETLYREKKDEFSFEILVGGEYLKTRKITTYDIFRPGMALAGYTGYFLGDRIAIIGKTEVSFLKTLPKRIKSRRIATVMRLVEPCIIVAKGLAIDKKFLEEAEKRKIPILRTPMSTTPFIHKLSTYLDYKLAPTKYIQGTLVDIYGVGVLLIGKPGTGKSECALDLIERGHRLVVDDLVKIIQRGNILVGSGAEKSDRLRHHIEIRGVGIVDIFRIFGVKSVRLRKRIEVVIELVLWDESKGDFDRVGLQRKTKTILDVKIPRYVVPLTPGKNISVIAEVIAMNHLLELRGIRPAEEYDRELRRVLSQMETPSVHYDEDIE